MNWWLMRYRYGNSYKLSLINFVIIIILQIALFRCTGTHAYIHFDLPQEDIPGIDVNAHHMMPGMTQLLLRSPGFSRLETFCYTGHPCTLTTLLKTVELILRVPNDNFYYYEGENASTVEYKYKEQSWFSFSPWRPSSFRLSNYNYSCIGIETSETFTAHLNVRYVDFWRIVTLGIGSCIFFSAPILARNVVFHYATGVSIGVFGSLLLVVFLVSRMIPKKTGAITVLIGGWGLVLYTLQYLWMNCLSFIKDYQTVVAGYITVAGLISFAVVYRWGPIRDVRSLKLVQWSLQLVGLSLIFASSQCKEFTMALILMFLAHYNIPFSWRNKMKTYWYRHFPPKRCLLTEEEYLEQTRQETKKALEDLRKYCHSPDCNAWKTMSRLKSPQRFAEFVEGKCHLMDDEILSYERVCYSDEPVESDNEMMLTDDEDAPRTKFHCR